MSDLKPCPKCGDAWIYSAFGDWASGYELYGYRVNCKCGYAWKALEEWFPSKEKATEAWNRRETHMIKVFISQPMRDKTDEQIEAEREKAIRFIKESIKGEEVEIIDSFFKDAPHEAKPLWFLGKSLQLLSSADVAYFVKGWQDSRGCRIEHDCAYEYGIKFFEEADTPHKCGDCEDYHICEEYVTDDETFPEVGGCPAFKAKKEESNDKP